MCVHFYHGTNAIPQTSGEADEDYVAGLDVVFKSLTAPMMQIAANAGIDGEVRKGVPRLFYAPLHGCDLLCLLWFLHLESSFVPSMPPGFFFLHNYFKSGSVLFSSFSGRGDEELGKRCLRLGLQRRHRHLRKLVRSWHFGPR